MADPIDSPDARFVEMAREFMDAMKKSNIRDEYAFKGFSLYEKELATLLSTTAREARNAGLEEAAAVCEAAAAVQEASFPECNDWELHRAQAARNMGIGLSHSIRLRTLKTTDKEPVSLEDPWKGKRLRKKSGYKFEGTGLGGFMKCDGKTMFVNIEHDDEWVMHFRPADIEEVPASDKEPG